MAGLNAFIQTSSTAIYRVVEHVHRKYALLNIWLQFYNSFGDDSFATCGSLLNDDIDLPVGRKERQQFTERLE